MNALLKVLSTGAILFAAAQSHALAADRFVCDLKIQDAASTASLKQRHEFNVARLPMSSGTAETTTVGNIVQDSTLHASKADHTASVNFYYKHAIKRDSAGKVIDARQFTCLTVAASYCDHSGPDDMVLCHSGRTACKEPSDPFSSTDGWTPVSVIHGHPTFNERALGPVNTTIYDDNRTARGEISLDCKYTGTYY